MSTDMCLSLPLGTRMLAQQQTGGMRDRDPPTPRPTVQTMCTSTRWNRQTYHRDGERTGARCETVAVQQVETDTNRSQVLDESHIQVRRQGIYSKEVRHQDTYDKECTYTKK
mmetsp:Transcript_47431/g.76425  ORF Transcript_47431/g.76425 Transcript_47431/m.76425 type:complete len:112 (+) Transcript_47431:242-577(+)